MTSWRSAEDWRLELPLDGIRVTVERSEKRVSLDYGLSAERLVLDVRESAEGPQHDQKADAAYAALRAQYGDSFRPLIDYRARVTWVALVLVASHLLYLFLLLRYGDKAGIGPKLRSGGLCIPLVAWIGVGAWLHWAYFP